MLKLEMLYSFILVVRRHNIFSRNELKLKLWLSIIDIYYLFDISIISLRYRSGIRVYLLLLVIKAYIKMLTVH